MKSKMADIERPQGDASLASEGRVTVARSWTALVLLFVASLLFPTASLLFPTASLLFPTAALAKDPLDAITGTEQWRPSHRMDNASEWRQWLAARNAWRKARRALRVEQDRNRQVAKVLRKGKSPDAPRVRKSSLRKRRRSGARSQRRRTQQGRNRRRPAVESVPIEALDDTGQVLDVEKMPMGRGRGGRR